jgi:hypothetical protein
VHYHQYRCALLYNLERRVSERTDPYTSWTDAPIHFPQLPKHLRGSDAAQRGSRTEQIRSLQIRALSSIVVPIFQHRAMIG